MPLVSISHKPGYSPEMLGKLKRQLPVIVSQELSCDEEEFDGDVRRGDVVVRLDASLPPDAALDVLVEIQTKYYASRARDIGVRAERIRRRMEQLGVNGFGVWVALPTAGWSQD